MNSTGSLVDEPRRYQSCLVAAAAGDRRALTTLVEDLTPLVWHVARGQGLNREAAEEVVQSVWLTLVVPRPGGNTRDDQLWAAFTRLPQRCQELLRLTVLAGRVDYRIVADVLHMPNGSIGPARGRCLGMLREQLQQGPNDSDQPPSVTETPALFDALGEAIDGVDPLPVELVPRSTG